MNHRRARVGVASLLAALALAATAVLLGASTAGATPRTATFHATFHDMLPGSHGSRTWPLEVRRDAMITRVEMSQNGPGDVDWVAQLCSRSTGDCTLLQPGRPDSRLTAGTHDLTLSVHVHDLPGGTTNSVDGRMVVTETPAGTDGDRLAMTGGAPLALLGVAGAALLLGLLVLGARRGRPMEPLAQEVSS